jgi:hypothetical protein
MLLLREFFDPSKNAGRVGHVYIAGKESFLMLFFQQPIEGRGDCDQDAYEQMEIENDNDTHYPDCFFLVDACKGPATHSPG